MSEQKKMTPAELADLLEAKAKKLRETDDIDSVWGGEGEEGAVGGCNDCCGSHCFSETERCSSQEPGRNTQVCRHTCIIKSSN